MINLYKRYIQNKHIILIKLLIFIEKYVKNYFNKNKKLKLYKNIYLI